MKITSPERLYDVPEVATIVNLHPDFIYKLIRRGDLPAVRVGRAVRVRESTLASWIASRESPTT